MQGHLLPRPGRDKEGDERRERASPTTWRRGHPAVRAQALQSLLRVPPTPRTHAGQLTCPLENMNTRAAPAAVSPQVKRVPSKAWNTALWPRSMLDTAVCRGATGQCPRCPRSLLVTRTCSEL